MKAAILAIFFIGGVCSIPIDMPKESMMDVKTKVPKETTTMVVETTTSMMEKPEVTTTMMEKPEVTTTMIEKPEVTTTLMLEEKPTKMTMKDKSDELEGQTTTLLMSTTSDKSDESKSNEKDNSDMSTTTQLVIDTMNEKKTMGTEKKEGKMTKATEKETAMPINDMVVAAVPMGQDAPMISLQLDAKAQTDEPLVVSTVTKMTDEMQRDMVSWAREGFRLYKDNEYLVAKHIVTEADAKLGPYWHCAAGESFEAYFTFEKDTFMRMSKGKVHVQCYKHFCSE